ncbi:hypothetical protein [Nonomuraea sp. NPDC049750]
MERANELLKAAPGEETPDYLRFYGWSFADAETASPPSDAQRRAAGRY